MRRTLLAALALLLLTACAGGETSTNGSSATSSTGSADAVSGSTSSSSGAPSSTTSATATSTSSTGESTGETGEGAGGRCYPYMPECPRGEKCSAWASDGGKVPNANKCVPIDPDPKEAGEPCVAEEGVTGIDDCDAGLFCWHPYDDLAGYCVEFCTGSYRFPQCPDNKTCFIGAAGTWDLCRPLCDPLDPDACAPGESCILRYGDAFICMWTAFDGADGEPCDVSQQCSAGTFCADATTLANCPWDRCCTSYCDLDAPNTCPQKDLGAECVPYFDPPLPGKETLGFCGAPP